ncbi:MAG: tRNA (adenosine(37)-N6)-threonylcarbamoyltransferase complex ATPase subunit type 1 TsaE [Ignavibacteriae bacterium]|nr:MAG: tRNA (adenosine(37)-N6)-threonylcarbamoyltransferase complex ATPase subunit type 1 TsaE [Ignavibacteriota bacterium]
MLSKSPEETQKYGKAIGSVLKDKDIVLFYGELGSGKTQLIKGICSALGVKQVVNSPTFIIVNEYVSGDNKNIYHFDLYRLKSAEEVIDIGLDDYLKDRGIILIEWPELIEDILPAGSKKVFISHVNGNENSRYIKFYPVEE